MEKRLFDAWGNVLVQDGAGNTLSGLTVLDRGYTGHEHLQSVGLIHMNGRLYDPKLHRFLQPDNYVQDPNNTQNYNRYGYVLNNPLKYMDPSGEKLTPVEECKQCGNTNYYSPEQQNANGEAIKALYDELSPWLEKNFSARNFGRAWDATTKAFEDTGNFIGRNAKSLWKDIFGGKKSSGPAPNRASYANIQMPTQHTFAGINMTALSEGNFLQQTIYGIANSTVNIPIQYMMGRGVGDGSMRNLNGTATTTDEGVLAFGTLPLWYAGGEGTTVLAQSERMALSSKLASHVLENASWLNKGNWWRLGLGKHNGEEFIRLAWGAHPKYLDKVPKYLQGLNKLIRNIGGGHWDFPNWKP